MDAQLNVLRDSGYDLRAIRQGSDPALTGHYWTIYQIQPPVRPRQASSDPKQAIERAFEEVLQLPRRLPPSGSQTLDNYLLPDGRELHVIHGQPVSVRGMTLLKDEIAPQAIEHPEEWVFLVEGADNERLEFANEIALANRIARILGVPIRNPVVTGIEDESMITELAHTLLGESARAADILGIWILPYIKANTPRVLIPGRPPARPDPDSFAYDAMAKHLNYMSSRELKASVVRFLGLSEAYPEEYPAFDRMIHDALKEATDPKNLERLTGLLEEFRDRRHVLVLVTEANVSVVSSIPGAKKLEEIVLDEDSIRGMLSDKTPASIVRAVTDELSGKHFGSLELAEQAVRALRDRLAGTLIRACV